MINRPPRSLLAIATCLALSSAATAGDLNPPPGAVAPTPGPEPRKAVNAANTPGDATNIFIISAPGSYYLSGNIAGVTGKNGVKIAAGGVTLDLMGFALIGAAGSLDGVTMTAFADNVVVRDGLISGWGHNGMHTEIDSGRIERIVASDNGGWGVLNDVSAFTAHIISCEARHNGALVANTGGIRGGVSAVLRDCIARQNIGTGISIFGAGGRVEGCSSALSSGDGFAIGDQCVVSRCAASTNGGAGVRTSDGALVQDCEAMSNTGDNIVVGGSSSVIHCVANNSVSGHGIDASLTQSLVQGCTANANLLSGVQAAQRTQVIDCVASNNHQHGVHITLLGVVRGCLCNGNTICGILTDTGGADILENNCTENGAAGAGAGIRVTASGCRVEGNTASLNLQGLDIQAGGNFITRNHYRLNTTANNIAGGNTVGPTVDASTIATSNSPNANYNY